MQRKQALTWAPQMPSSGSKTFWGGYPLWPKDEPWPMDEGWEGRPPKEAMFLAQFDIAALPWRPPEFPDSGTLYLFSDPDIEPNFGQEIEGFYVYVASADRELERRSPIQRRWGEATHLFAGGLTTGDRKDPTVWQARDSFAAFSLDLVEFEDPWAPNLRYNNVRTKDARLARKTALEDALSEQGQGVGWREANVDQEWRVACANIIDPDGLRFSLPMMGLPTAIPDDPRHADWPLCSGNILYHCVKIAFARFRNGERPLSEDSLAKRIQAEAKDWASWAKDRQNKILSDNERARYRKWASECFVEVVDKWKEITPHSLPEDPQDQFISSGAETTIFGRIRYFLTGQQDETTEIVPYRKKLERGSEREAEYRGLCHVLESIFECNPYWTDFGLINLDAEELEKLPSWAKRKYLEQCPRGQLFGFGHDEHGEVDRNKDHLFLADIYSGADVGVAAAYKVYIVGDLRMNSWQKVVIEHPT